MATWIRRIVSGQKKRFQNEEFDLDLAYISPRIIAMGLPAQGKDVLYRNPLPEIARFLQKYHNGRAKVYNLCSEYSYSAQKLSVALQHYPFDDHQTPSLLLVQQFCADAASWLAQHSHNVVVVHCKAGKGRTGLMICCLLMYLHKNAPDLANLAPVATSAVLGPSAATTGNCNSSDILSGTPADPAVAVALSDVHAATAAAIPCADRVLGRTVSDISVINAHGSLGSSSSSSSSTTSSTRPGLTGTALFRSKSVPSYNTGWHPWQHVEPVQLQQLSLLVQDVLELYAERRTHDGNGVTIASQRRYVGYFWHVLTSGTQPCGVLPKPRVLQLRRLAISGLPPGTADSCSVLVEARPSGSTAASPTTVWMYPARRALIGSVSGLQLCMGPCSVAPEVLEDECRVLVSTAGDRLAIQMPAASLGLNLLSSSAAAVTAAGTAAAGDTVHGNNHMQAATADQELPSPFAVVACGNEQSCMASSLGTVSATADGCSISEAGGLSGCCVVEGDVRVTVFRGGSKLFFAWFNTAFVAGAGSFTLDKFHLDKVAKNLPNTLSLTVNFIDMQPQAESEFNAAAASTMGGSEQHQPQYWEESRIPETCLAGAGTNSSNHQARVPAPLTIPNSCSNNSLPVADCSSSLLLLGSSLSAPASPEASRVARATSWLQLPALPSLGSLPSPLQWPGSSSSHREAGDKETADVLGVGFSSVPAVAGAKGVRRDRRSTGKGKHRAAGRAARRLQYDNAGTHFWDWNWESLAAAAAATDAVDAPEVAAASPEEQQLQACTHPAATKMDQWQPDTFSRLHQHQQTSQGCNAAAAGIELPTLRCPGGAAAAGTAPLAAAAAPCQALGWQQQEKQPWVSSLVDDEDDGGDVFAADIYGRPGSLDLLLHASSPSAATGAVLGAHDPLQGLLEAWHWSIDSQTNRRQQWRWQAYSNSSNSSSRASSPGPDSILRSSSSRVQSCPATPHTPTAGSNGSSSSTVGWSSTRGVHSLGAKSESATKPRSVLASALRASGVADAVCTLHPSMDLPAADVPVKAVEGLCGTLATDVAIAPVTPPAAAHVLSAQLAGREPAGEQMQSSHAAAGLSCLDCLFDTHTGPCPVAVQAGTAPVAAVLPQPAFAELHVNDAADVAPIADTPVVGSIRRTSSTPDSSAVAAAAAAASCKVMLVTSIAAGAAEAGAAAANSSAAAVAEATSVVGNKSHRSLAPPKAAVVASSGRGANVKGWGPSRLSMDSTKGTNRNSSGLQSVKAAASRAVVRRSTTGDLASHTSEGCFDDDQAQRLLQCGQQRSCGPAADAAVDGHRTGAAVVQQWQHLERVWQRNWL